jgi:hypothetical protein
MRWVGHIALSWRKEVGTEFWRGNLSERKHLEDPGMDGGLILKLIFEKWSKSIDWIDLTRDR